MIRLNWTKLGIPVGVLIPCLLRARTYKSTILSQQHGWKLRNRNKQVPWEPGYCASWTHTSRRLGGTSTNASKKQGMEPMKKLLCSLKREMVDIECYKCGKRGHIAREWSGADAHEHCGGGGTRPQQMREQIFPKLCQGSGQSKLCASWQSTHRRSDYKSQSSGKHQESQESDHSPLQQQIVVHKHRGWSRLDDHVPLHHRNINSWSSSCCSTSSPSFAGQLSS